MAFLEGIRSALGKNFSAPTAWPDYDRIKSHVIGRLRATDAHFDPFGHAWVEEVFPPDFYDRLFAHMKAHKTEDKMQPRLQDNPEFANRRFNLVDNKDEEIRIFHAIWSDPDVKRAAFEKFYDDSSADALARDAYIHEEFEYVFCQPDRFQNIHVDIPPKVLSFVFYMPDGPVTDEEELKNATILYGKDLQPRYAARFRKNSVCIFAAHYYSYHGFSSTIERDAIVMFLVEPKEMKRWRRLRRNEDKPFEGILEAIDGKLQRFTLKEYGTDAEKRAQERADCRINAPKGRVLVD